MKVPSMNLGPRYTGNITNTEQNMILLLSYQYLPFLYSVVFLIVYGHIVYAWNMDYKFPELSNYSYLRQETTPLRDVQIRIFAQMPKAS